MKGLVAFVLIGFSIAGCSRAPVQEGVFFPTWSAEGAVPAGIVQGALVEDDQCLLVERDGQRTLVVWEDGMGFDDGTLFDASASPIAEVGEVIHGGGGYTSRGHVEELSGGSIPQRCVPDEGSDRFAIIYDVGAGSFE